MVKGLDYISKKLVGQRFDGTKREHSVSHAYEIIGVGLDGKIEVKYLDEDMPTFDRIEWQEFLQHKRLATRKNELVVKVAS